MTADVQAGAARPPTGIPAPAGPIRHVVLVGPMGVGKSTDGRRLADELQRPAADAPTVSP